MMNAMKAEAYMPKLKYHLLTGCYNTSVRLPTLESLCKSELVQRSITHQPFTIATEQQALLAQLLDVIQRRQHNRGSEPIEA